MPVLETDEERAKNRLQSAARIFYIMAVAKVLELMGMLRPPMEVVGGPPSGARQTLLTSLFIAYGISIVLCVVIGRNLEARRLWARNLALAFGALHIGAFFLIGYLGPMVILSGVLGVIGFFSVLVASGLGAFDDVGT